jgi:hypothetical protein
VAAIGDFVNQQLFTLIFAIFKKQRRSIMGFMFYIIIIVRNALNQNIKELYLKLATNDNKENILEFYVRDYGKINFSKNYAC